MATVPSAALATRFRTRIPAAWNTRASLFGDIVLVTFLLAQCFDGVFTYVGVVTFGTAIEANPVVGLLMLPLGQGFAVMAAKAVAGSLGILLDVRDIHSAVAALTGFYL